MMQMPDEADRCAMQPMRRTELVDVSFAVFQKVHGGPRLPAVLCWHVRYDLHRHSGPTHGAFDGIEASVFT